jgi:putative addiction module antidote
MHTLKLRKIGSSVGVILPKELLETLHLQEGDSVFADAGKDELRITPYDPDFDAAMEAFARTRRKYRNALRELAK